MDLQSHTGTERGAAAKLARALDVPPVLISQWANGTRPVPDARCPDIERATDGRVTVDDLRPDVKWARVPDADWPHPQGRPCIDVAAPTAPAAEARAA